MLYRLESMILMGLEIPLPAIRRQIASGLDIIVHLGRLRDHTRKVLEIVEVIGFEDGEIIAAPLFEFMEEGEDEKGKIHGKLLKVGDLLKVEKLKSAGIKEDG